MNFMGCSPKSANSKRPVDALARAQPVQHELDDLVRHRRLAVFADRPEAQRPYRAEEIDEIRGELDIPDPEVAVARRLRQEIAEHRDILRVELVDLSARLGRQRLGLLEHELDEAVVL